MANDNLAKLLHTRYDGKQVVTDKLFKHTDRNGPQAGDFEDRMNKLFQVKDKKEVARKNRTLKASNAHIVNAHDRRDAKQTQNNIAKWKEQNPGKDYKSAYTSALMADRRSRADNDVLGTEVHTPAKYREKAHTSYQGGKAHEAHQHLREAVGNLMAAGNKSNSKINQSVRRQPWL